MWGCAAHWYMLPRSIRDQIWATYRVGQEKDGRVSPEYMRAFHAAIAWIRANHPPQTPIGVTGELPFSYDDGPAKGGIDATQP